MATNQGFWRSKTQKLAPKEHESKQKLLRC
ncbi:uncharacterized protein G2W53_034784 [Senna tora]|uniref:Uncharacterized protein n=1 Tax=Senna tora TaxID=362788 RepID=A0A834T272_9FABA|nr:uncharacterized protein G2W53_034784 [Senna tora]